MPSAHSTRTPVLAPITIVHQGQSIDLALPTRLPLIDILPALAKHIGGLDSGSSSYGMQLLTEDGMPLDDSHSLQHQQIAPGSVLTLTLRDTEAEPRYDDLVEAVATAVERQQQAWSRRDSLAMSVAATCILFLIGGCLLLRQGHGSWLTPACASIGVALLLLSAHAINRTAQVGAWSVILTAGVLAGIAGYTGIAGPPFGLRLVAAGGCAAMLLCTSISLLEKDRPLVAGPLLICGVLAITGLSTQIWNQPLPHVLALITATSAVISLVLPWIALAAVPVTISLPNQPDALHRAEDTTGVTPMATARIMSLHGLVLSVRIACSVVILFCLPAVASIGEHGVALIAAIGAASLLATRAVRSRADVSASVVGGMLTLVLLTLVISATRTDLVMPMVVMVGVTGLAVLLLNVLGPTYRPRLTRAADLMEILTLMSIIPLTALAIGVL